MVQLVWLVEDMVVLIAHLKSLNVQAAMSLNISSRLFRTMCEIAAWLENPSGTKYAIAVDLKEYNGKITLEIFLLKSSSVRRCSAEEIKDYNEKLVQEWSDRKKQPQGSKKYCEEKEKGNVRSETDLKRIYGLILVNI